MSYCRLGNVKFQRGARDVFSLSHTDEVAQMPKLHRKNPKNSKRKILIRFRYKEATNTIYPACVRRTPYCGMSEMVEGGAANSNKSHARKEKSDPDNLAS